MPAPTQISQTTKPITDCINKTADVNVFNGFSDIIYGFITFAPKIIEPDFITKFISEGSKSIVDLFLSNLKGLNVPSFSFKFETVSIKFDGIDIAPPGIDPLTIFDPSGLISFITGLLGVALKIPELFFDLKKKPPQPKIPNLPKDLESIVLKAFGGLFGSDLYAQITQIKGFETFPVTFANCIATSLTGVLK